MTEPAQISPSTSDNTPWWQYIMGQKNSSATASNAYPNSSGGSSNPLSGFGGNINSQTAGGGTESPTGSFNPQGSLPSAPTTQNAAQSPLGNVGNTQSTGTGTASGIVQGNTQQLLNTPTQTSPAVSNQVQSQSTGLSGFGNIVSSFGGQGLKLSGIGNSAISSLNDFGASIGFGGVPAEAFGPSAAGATEAYGPAYGGASSAANGVTSTSLSGVLGGAGIGAGIGSIYGMLTGLQGPNAGNASIGGGIGGAIGSAILPGIGTALGSIGGSIIGGLFGPGAPTNAEGGGGQISSTGQVDYQLGGQKNPGSIAGFTEKATSTFSGLAQAASSSLGFQFAPGLDFAAAISTKHPGPGGDAALGINNSTNNYTSGKLFFNPQDSTSVTNTYYTALLDAAQQSGYTDTTSLYNWFYQQGGSTGSSGTNNQLTNNVNIAPKGNYANTGSIIA